jgi:putative endonuclease
MFSVYILWSNKLRKHYVGCARNVERRLAEHQSGRNRFTKGGIPWTLVHVEEFVDLPAARKRETFLKSGAGRSWFKELLFLQTRA